MTEQNIFIIAIELWGILGFIYVCLNIIIPVKIIKLLKKRILIISKYNNNKKGIKQNENHHEYQIEQEINRTDINFSIMVLLKMFLFQWVIFLLIISISQLIIQFDTTIGNSND